MTTWLEIREEPMTEEVVIEVKWELYGLEGKEYTLICHTGLCGWYDIAFSPEQVVEVKAIHTQWHEDGCPE